MSLLGWVTGAKPKAQPVKKTSEEKRETQKVYETKRQRKFQTAWQETFSWLVYDDEKNSMFCKVCRDLETAGTFCTGNSNFKIDTIRIHDTADAHKFNVAKFNAKSMPVAQSIAAKSPVLLDKSRVGKLCTLFRTAHGMAKSGRPYTDFVWLCSLNEANGLDIGKTYRNDKAAQKCVTTIADTQRDIQKEIVDKANFISIIADGSTDTASRETEIIYLRTSLKCQVSTLLVALKHVPKADAANISSAIFHAMTERFGDSWQQKFVGMGTDGASVMIGQKSGVVKRMADRTERPFIRGIHCSAHRLELAYRDAVKGIPVHQRCELLLQNLYLFYKYSPLNRANLVEAFKALGVKPLIPKRAGGTRWLPHTQKALANLISGREGVIMHIEQMQQTPGSESSAKAKNFLKLLNDRHVKTWLNFLMDVVKCLSKVSLAIQMRDSTLCDIFEELETSKVVLQRYLTSPGPYLRKYFEGSSQSEDLVKAQREKLLNALVLKLQGRFDADMKVFGQSNFLALDKWPDLTEQLEFGDENIIQLVDSCRLPLQECVPGMDPDSIETEWIGLKTALRKRKQMVNNMSWCSMEVQFGQSFPNLFHLVNYLLALPGSSVDAERGFSIMKVIKNDWRSRLGDRNLSDLVLVSLETPIVSQYNPMPAVQRWLTCGSRARRPYYKDELKRCYGPVVIGHMQPVLVDGEEAESTGEVNGDGGEAMEEMEEEEEGQAEEEMEEEGQMARCGEESDSDEEEKLSRRELLMLQNKQYKLLMDSMNIKN